MSNIPKSFMENVEKIYKKAKYLDKYGGSVIISAVILFIFWLIVSYHLVKGQMKPIKKDWVNRRCSPAVMPFAGLINAPAGTSKIAFTGQNFSGCITTILKEVLGEILKPLYYAAHMITKLVDELKKAIDDVRKVFATLRNDITTITQEIANRILNMLAPVLVVLVKTKDILAKTAGVLTSNLLFIFGAYDTLKSLLGAFIELLIIAIIALVAAIVIAWIMPWTWPFAIILTVIFVFVAVLCAIIVYWLDKILHLTASGTPSSSCFDEDTKIETMNGYKLIKHISPGELLADGSRVTAIFKMTAAGEDMYQYEHIVVSGSHQLMTPLGKCLAVSNHPASEYIAEYNKPYLYCLSTTSKIINIDGHIFSDWDEVDDFDWKNIKQRAKPYLPNYPCKEHIHEYLESGLYGEYALLNYRMGKVLPLKNIQVGDNLKYGVRVLGIVKIASKDLVVKEYNIKGNFIICSPNVPFIDNLGNTTTLKMHRESPYCLKMILYHLVTDKKCFTIYDMSPFYDYNGVIEGNDGGHQAFYFLLFNLLSMKYV